MEDSSAQSLEKASSQIEEAKQSFEKRAQELEAQTSRTVDKAVADITSSQNELVSQMHKTCSSIETMHNALAK
jgi:hypothetical protein